MSKQVFSARVTRLLEISKLTQQFAQAEGEVSRTEIRAIQKYKRLLSGMYSDKKLAPIAKNFSLMIDEMIAYHKSKDIEHFAEIHRLFAENQALARDVI